MKKIILITILLSIVLISGCIQKPQISSQVRACPGIYYLEDSLNKEINNDQEAFNILKEGKTYDNQNYTTWVEDHIPSDMKVEEALNKGLFKNNEKINLESEEVVQPVWTFVEKDKALDKNGNVYACKY